MRRGAGAGSAAEVQGEDDILDDRHITPEVEHIDDGQSDAGEADEDQYKEDKTAEDQPGRGATAFFAHGVGIVIVAGVLLWWRRRIGITGGRLLIIAGLLLGRGRLLGVSGIGRLLLRIGFKARRDRRAAACLANRILSAAACRSVRAVASAFEGAARVAQMGASSAWTARSAVLLAGR